MAPQSTTAFTLLSDDAISIQGDSIAPAVGMGNWPFLWDAFLEKL